MRLTRAARRGSVRVSLVAMIDVLMIMLVFFMVTSTYLDLDMVPVADRAAEAPPPVGAAGQSGGARALIRIGGDGRAHLGGRAIAAADLPAALARRVAADPGLEVIVLPSGNAPVQALVTVMDAATGAGVSRLRVVRLEGRP
ncbi:biopolymer transporter ExbD [Rhodobacteraceae bacterium CCMM004]|nr:biopolymer transporter ExbD [Rhodobacteraceae bacterium CCMM004]